MLKDKRGLRVVEEGGTVRYYPMRLAGGVNLRLVRQKFGEVLLYLMKAEQSFPTLEGWQQYSGLASAGLFQFLMGLFVWSYRCGVWILSCVASLVLVEAG